MIAASSTAARLVVCAVALLALAACSRDARVPVPLPKLPDGPIELRVVHLVNPRFPTLSGEEVQTLLAAAAATVKAHFGRDVQFSVPVVQPIEIYFQKFDADARKKLAAEIYDFRNGKGDRKLLGKQFEKDLRETEEDVDALIAYARPYLLKRVTERSYAALVDALLSTQLARLDALKSERAADGQPVLDGQPYNEVVYWDAMAAFPLPYEVIVTNQLIASIEYANNSVHSALRGGITNGFTTPNPQSRYKTTAIVSTYPFVAEDSAIRALRAGESYARSDALRYGGVLLAHEIGHQLWHLGHPYGRTACVMAPAPLLHFRRWVEGHAPAECPIAQEGAMKPGAVKLYTSKPI